MNDDYSWDERINDFISILHNKNVNKSISTKKIFSSLSLLSNLVILFFLENEEKSITKKDDIFTRIKNRVKNIISQEIIDTEIDQQIKNLQPIKKLLLEYLVIQN
ncbi:9196_t:CDS:1 [Funneliformis geosporum]|uniref:492_t:CDS:1 n=1 Tax=Funneliformis geosporum TaxID=1117311 RepID=A0A9W4T0E4_9GLOM|nr:9196_t:CDS:1 [Funneliformis geosporum]CAI2187491.1 492_t:CDS:1 [Funneliformis geosporum]